MTKPLREMLNGTVLVEDIKDEEKTGAGIYIPDVQTKHKIQRARVINVGQSFPMGFGELLEALTSLLKVLVDKGENEKAKSLIDVLSKRVNTQVKVGDTVVYKFGMGTDIMVKEKSYKIVSEVNLLAIL